MLNCSSLQARSHARRIGTHFQDPRREAFQFPLKGDAVPPIAVLESDFHSSPKSFDALGRVLSNFEAKALRIPAKRWHRSVRLSQQRRSKLPALSRAVTDLYILTEFFRIYRLDMSVFTTVSLETRSSEDSITFVIYPNADQEMDSASIWSEGLPPVSSQLLAVQAQTGKFSQIRPEQGSAQLERTLYPQQVRREVRLDSP